MLRYFFQNLRDRKLFVSFERGKVSRSRNCLSRAYIVAFAHARNVLYVRQ